MKKLKVVKQSLKELNKDGFSDIHVAEVSLSEYDGSSEDDASAPYQ